MASTAASGSSSNGSTPQGSSQTSVRRTRSVGTKLSDEEYAQLESLAATQGVTLGECVRELVLAAFGKPMAGKPAAGKPAAEATVAEQTVLSEVLALSAVDDQALHSRILYDGLGRQKETDQYETTCSYIFAQITYDPLGRVYSRSNPACHNVSSSAVSTTYAYDGLGRVTNTTTPDNSATIVQYMGNQATTTEAAYPTSVVKAATSDALERTTIIVEDRAGLNYTTGYQYDGADDLGKVCQGASFVVNSACTGTGVQARTFSYDSLQRLIHAYNPESTEIVTSYGYDENGNLTSKTDPNAVTTTMAYDGLNRIISKGYSDGPNGTPWVSYCYDGNTQSPCTGAPAAGAGLNLVGRLTMVYAGSGATYGQYDALGRVLKSTQTTGGASYPFTYTYNRVGSMTGMTFPSNRTETWAYDSANRVLGVSGAPSGGSSRPYASSILYWPQGEVSQMTLGNNRVETRGFSSDRLQPNSVTLGTSASDSSLLSLGIFYCPGSALSCTNNNGNVQSQTIGPLGATQIYGYDTANRLVSAQEGSTWSETFGYDPFGNRWANSPQGLPSPLTPMSLGAYDETTNRLSTASGNFLYDNNGNLTKMSPENLVYDAENRQTQISSARGLSSRLCASRQTLTRRLTPMTGTVGG